MKSSIKIGSITVLLLLAAGGVYFFVIPKRRPHAPEGLAHPVKHQVMLEGSVAAYGSNREGDVDQILLQTESGELPLHFPPHAARLITRTAPLNAFITAHADSHGHRAFELKHLKNKASNQEVNLADIPPPAPSPGQEVTVSGIRVDASETNRFILSKKQISLPPHMAAELIPRIRNAKTIVIRGKMRDSTEGFVSASGLPVIRATLVQLDSITYKIR